jgi:iron complex transport system ATP-binding protein
MSQLRATNVHVRKNGVAILNAVDCELNAGEMLGVVGPNGSGKTTLLRSLLGLERPWQGEVRFGERLIATISAAEKSRAIGYLPQGARFHWPISVSEAVMLGRYAFRGPWGRASAKDREAAAAAMEAADVMRLAGRTVDRLSGGEKMRVHLARLIAGEHRYLLADEPTTSLDPYYQIEILDQLRGLADSGVGILLVIHDLPLAVRYCDRLVVLSHGRVVTAAAPRSALSPAVLADVFDVIGDWDPEAPQRLHIEATVPRNGRLPPKN